MILSHESYPCLQDLARLKIALNILAHVPKSLLDPDIDPPVWPDSSLDQGQVGQPMPKVLGEPKDGNAVMRAESRL